MHSSAPSAASFSRRHLLQWISGVSALLATPACVRKSRDFLIPYDRMPEHGEPGEKLSYATAMNWEGYGLGLLVDTHMGRPTKIEGNPDHPASLGATDIFAQASVLALYDPERAQRVRHAKAESTWDRFVDVLRTHLNRPEGRRFRMLVSPQSSPTLLDSIRLVQEKYPDILWHRFEAMPSSDHASDVDILYDFVKADIIVSFDADFFSQGPGRLAYSRAFAERRRGGTEPMNRLYSLHTTPSLVSTIADHRMPLSIQGLSSALMALAEALEGPIRNPGVLTADQKLWIEALASDLKTHQGRSLVLMDNFQDASMRQLALRINARLGNIGTTMWGIEPLREAPGVVWHSEQELLKALAAREIDGLFCLGANPLYHSAAYSLYQEMLPRLSFSAQLSSHFDETSAYVQWHLPQQHDLESWGDIRAFDGTVSLIQPTIDPLFASVSMLACVQALLPSAAKSDYDCVRAYWQKQKGKEHFEDDWNLWLRSGFIPGTRKAGRAIPQTIATMPMKQATAFPPDDQSPRADLILRPDPTVWDGTVANNPWLQELPKPLSHLTWDHALAISPALAASLKLQTGDWVQLDGGNGAWEIPVHIFSQQPAATMTLTLGYGRQSPGLLCSGIGINAFHLRQGHETWSFEQVAVRKLERQSHPLAFAQTHFEAYAQERVIRKVDWQEFLKDPQMFQREALADARQEPTLPIAPHRVLNKDPDPLQWGMSIDTSACIGCNACVLACQAENNIPIVGKDQVLAGRLMHWLRIDTYFDEPTPQSDGSFQPVPCMHCETAPCEVVCPVGATSHSEEGLNQMVYNRCVGTRYCSNNCPYKVRHFNFYAYAETNSLASLQRNPDVTVRSRGVMEKCTYCVQRIAAARSQAARDHRPISDGALQTACEQACPTRAITFGNSADPQSRVAIEKKDPRRYALLGELNTKPRTTYLAHLKNFSARLKKLGLRAGR